MGKLNKLAIKYIKFPVSYSSFGTHVTDSDGKHIVDIRGWGWIQKLAHAEDIQDTIGQYVVDAINEKYERQHPTLMEKTTDE